MTDGDEYMEKRCSPRHRLVLTEHQQATIEFVEYFATVDTKSIVLDAGCGEGFFLEILRNLGFTSICGIDTDSSYVEQGREKGLRVVKGSVYNLDVRQELDVVLLCDILEHLENPGLAITRVYDSLKDGGIVYLIAPVYDTVKKTKFWDKLFRRSKKDKPKGTLEDVKHVFSTENLVWLLESHQLSIERTVHTGNRQPDVKDPEQQFRLSRWVSIVARKQPHKQYTDEDMQWTSLKRKDQSSTTTIPPIEVPYEQPDVGFDNDDARELLEEDYDDEETLS
ncbi:MAG: class I SAM-dependent methyltransferase [Deltaproteobacteria bacterium]|nr:class I SAM-dependent methyltransferase [Deltaproteobacteria bacterium]